jgi:MoxR-like ATPase
MNDDASTFELPEYIHSRLQPRIFIDFPEPDEERLILQRNLPFAPKDILDYVVRFLQLAHQAHERYTVRDGINIARYSLKVLESNRLLSGAPREDRPGRALRLAIEMILGDQALMYFS